MKILTGITTSGTPHIGNYVGAIRPALQRMSNSTDEFFYFLADYHSLIKTKNPNEVKRSTLDIAATWLALGLDPNKVNFYRQSDIPQITELQWMLSCATGFGLVERSHAFKSIIASNVDSGNYAHRGINVGLFMYPILMAADILLFNADIIPVGKDQVQHIDTIRDIAQSFNNYYGNLLVLPTPLISSNEILIGLDGRKMSKSYHNTIPVFSTVSELKSLVAKIVTDSTPKDAPKSTKESTLFNIFEHFASVTETREMSENYAAGIGWGDVKTRLVTVIDREISPHRDQYAYYSQSTQGKQELRDILRDGAVKTRIIASSNIEKLREAVGLNAI